MSLFRKKRNRIYSSMKPSVITTGDVASFAKPYGVLLRKGLSDIDEVDKGGKKTKDPREKFDLKNIDVIRLADNNFEKVYEEYQAVYSEFESIISLLKIGDNVSKSDKGKLGKFVSKEFGKPEDRKYDIFKLSKKDSKQQVELIKYFDNIRGMSGIGFWSIVDLDIDDKDVERLKNEFDISIEELSNDIMDMIYEYTDELYNRINKEFKILDETGGVRNRRMSEYRGYLVIELLYTLDELYALIDFINKSYNELDEYFMSGSEISMDEAGDEAKRVIDAMNEYIDIMNSIISECKFIYNSNAIYDEFREYLDGIQDSVNKKIKELKKQRLLGKTVKKGFDLLSWIFGDQ